MPIIQRWPRLLVPSRRWLSRGLTHLYTPERRVNLVSQAFLTPSGTVTFEGSPHGIVQTTAGSSSHVVDQVYTHTAAIDGTWTALAVFKTAGTVSNFAGLVGTGDSGGLRREFFLGSSGEYGFDYKYDDSQSKYNVISTEADDSDWHSAVLTVTGATGAFFDSGRSLGTATANIGAGTGAANVFRVGNLTSSLSYSFPGSIALAAYFDTTKLSDAEAIELSRDPWLLFEQPKRRFWVPSAAVTTYVFNPLSGRGGTAAQPLDQT